MPDPLPHYLINLDRSTDRLNEFMATNGHLRDVIRFQAFDGAKLDRGDLASRGILKQDVPYSSGAVGCAMSHIALWKMAASSENGFTVSEDDAIFSRAFPTRAREILAMLPANWDIMLWGWNFDAYVWLDVLPGVAGTTQMIFDQEALRTGIDQFQDLAVHRVPMRLRHGFGTICYSVSPKGAQCLLGRCLPINAPLIAFPGLEITIDNYGIDATLNGAYPHIEAFACMPPLVVTKNQRESSTVLGQ